MADQLPLLSGNIALDEALHQEDDILQELSYPDKRRKFYSYLIDHQFEIEEIVAFHLGVPKGACNAARELKDWVHGGFNACMPIYIDESIANCPRKVFVRFPLPYGVGEANNPGNAEEKLRTEAATYVWISKNCPKVPIPCLRAFGFAGGWSFTTPQHTPFLSRIAWNFKRAISWLTGNPVPVHYVGRQTPHKLETGYLIVDFVEEGKMLSDSWSSQREDDERRATLFTELARILLSLSHITFPRIGSFIIDNDGVMSLTNRPLTSLLQQLENFGVPTDMPRDFTYPTSDAYLMDLLACHDNRIRHSPNAIQSQKDAQDQLTALTMMRTVLPHFADRPLRHGPFVLTLTDLHESNIFVDSDWHITSLIDLEWACTRPIEMLQPPTWLADCTVDELHGEKLEEYRKLHAEFMEIFELEEEALGNGIQYTQIMRRSWDMGKFWFFCALDFPKSLYGLYTSHIKHIFTETQDDEGNFDRSASAYWGNDVSDFIKGKLKDKENYSHRIRKRFIGETKVEA